MIKESGAAGNASYFFLRLSNPKVIFRPLRLSFLLTFSINVLRSVLGVSAVVSFLLLAITRLL